MERYSQRADKSSKRQNGHVVLAEFDRSDIGSMSTAPMCKLLLRPTPLFPRSPEVGSEPNKSLVLLRHAGTMAIDIVFIDRV